MTTSPHDLVLLDSHALTLLPGGGLAFLEGGDDFLDEDWQKNVVPRLRFQNKQQMLLTLIALFPLLTHHRWCAVLGALVERGDVEKEDLFFLYRSQSPDVRVHSPYITLKDMWAIGADTLLTKEDLVALAEEVVTIDVDDVNFFLGGGGMFYRSANPFSNTFLKHWYKETKRFFAGSGKLASLIALALYEKNPNEVRFDSIEEKVVELARRSPGDHGISRYVGLLYMIAQDEKDGFKQALLKKRIHTTIAAIVVESLRSASSMSFYEGELLLTYFLEGDDIPKEDKQKIRIIVQHECDQIATRYLTFTDRIRACLEAGE